MPSFFLFDVLFDTFKSLRPVRRRRRTPVFALSGGYISQPADHPMPRLRATVTANGLCGTCIKKPPFFDRTVTAQIYKPPLSFLIRRYKYGDGWQLSSLLAKFLPPPPPTDSVLAVPLHPARERWRGFNQSRELAREIFGPSPANDKRILRVANTAPQTNQPNTAARKKNVRGAFQASDKLNGLSVLVVDDVMSSGATLNEIAKTLKKAGVKTVTNFIVARAP